MLPGSSGHAECLAQRIDAPGRAAVALVLVARGAVAAHEGLVGGQDLLPEIPVVFIQSDRRLGRPSAWGLTRMQDEMAGVVMPSVPVDSLTC